VNGSDAAPEVLLIIISKSFSVYGMG
jgi:hypothetical protein